MNTEALCGQPRWSPSVYYADGAVQCSLERAWRAMLDYAAWNPTFVNAEVTPVGGGRNCEGEIVLIRKSIMDVSGAPLPEFYAQTVKVVPLSHVVWYVYPKSKDDHSFCNFVDFGVAETSTGVTFSVYYYAQEELSGELLLRQRKAYSESLRNLVVAFKAYCETRET